MAFGVHYMLEIWNADGPVTAIAMPPTVSLQAPHVHATKLDWTLGTDPIREHTVNRHVPLVLTGHSGFSRRVGHDRHGDVITTDGPRLFLEFREFLAEYQRLAADSSARYLAAGTRYRDFRVGVHMVFRAFSEELHLRVEPDVLTPRRDAGTSRFSYDWSLNLRAYGLAERRPSIFDPRGPADASDVQQAAVDTLSTFGEQLQDFIARGRDGVAAVQAYLQGVRRHTLALVQAASELRQLGGDLRSVADTPRALLADAVAAAGEIRAALADAKDALSSATDNTEAEKDALGAMLASVEDALGACLEAYGVSRGGPDGLLAARKELTAESASAGGSAGLPAAKPELDVIVHVLAPGQTLQHVAREILGDPAAWSLIVMLNGFHDMHSDSAGAPLLPGTPILVPKPSGAAATASPDLNRIYGTDWYVDPVTGDLATNTQAVTIYDAAAGKVKSVPQPAAGFRLVRGVPSLVQALRARLATPQGYIVGQPAYGIPVVLGASLGPSTAGIVTARVREQLLRDPRVVGTPAVAVMDEGDHLTLAVEIRAAADTKVSVVAPLPKAVLS